MFHARHLHLHFTKIQLSCGIQGIGPKSCGQKHNLKQILLKTEAEQKVTQNIHEGEKKNWNLNRYLYRYYLY